MKVMKPNVGYFRKLGIDYHKSGFDQRFESLGTFLELLFYNDYLKDCIPNP